MSQADEEVQRNGPDRDDSSDSNQPGGEWVDLERVLRLARRRPVALAAVVLVIAQVAWRAQFLNHMYFFREDFFNFDLAIESPFSWHYLTFVGSGHLMIGERAIIWVLARMSFYNWGLASAVTLAFVAAADLAAFGALRALFGERPGILVPLMLYLLTPLTVADLGWWTAALESVPLQLAIFMAIGSHTRFLRTGRTRYAAATFAWFAAGLLFFEKGLVLPLVLFALTSGYAAGGGSWVWAARRTLLRYWRQWSLYAVVALGYAIMLASALRTSTTHPQPPNSLGDVVSFTWNLVKETFVPAALGGPWQWMALPGHWYALAGTPGELAWLALIVAAGLIGVSVARRPSAWRAWAILALWLVVADMLPVVISRLYWYPILLALDSRYVADAAPILAICVGLAFIPLAGAPAEVAGPRRARRHVVAERQPPDAAEQRWRTAAAALLAVVVLGSIGSTQDYESVTTGSEAASFMRNAVAAIRAAPRGTAVVDSAMPEDVTYQARDARASRVIGDVAPGKLRWIGEPTGTFDNLMIFGADGRLHLAQMYGMGSPPRPAGRNCWAQHGGQVRIPLFGPAPAGPELLRIGYLWYSQYQGLVTVRYGTSVTQAQVMPGLHGLFLRERGSAKSVVISGLGKIRLCVGDAEAGMLVPSAAGLTIPAVPAAMP